MSASMPGSAGKQRTGDKTTRHRGWKMALNSGRESLSFRHETAPVVGDLDAALRVNPTDPGSLNVFWLGQAGFAFRSDKRLLLADAYLSDALAKKYQGTLFTHQRMMPSPLAVDARVDADFLLASHAHSDHLDPGLLGPFMENNPNCQLVCPTSAKQTAVERGAPAERITTLEPGLGVAYDGVSIEAIASAHETVAYNDKGEHLFLGYVVEMAGIRFYHSGDCVPYDGLAVELAKRRIDIALLPVNGRDEFRTSHGIAGNFTIHEAARLCLTTGIRFMVPHHFGMFDFNTVNEAEIHQRLDGCLGLDYWLPSIGNMLALHSIERADSRRLTL